MAPEQIEGLRDVDARADVYAFGAVFYELLTGKQAWAGRSPFIPPRPNETAPDPRDEAAGVPLPIAALVQRCLSRRREGRPAAMAEVTAELDAISLTVPEAPARPPNTPSATEPALPAESDKTVAVLPFRNAGPPEDDYLAEELADDLIDSLSMTPGLRVKAKSTLLRFRAEARDVRDVGLEIGVAAVVEGSVRRAGEGVRMTVRVIGVADGFQLWAKRWDLRTQDLLAVNDEAAHAIAAALGVSGPEAREAPGDAGTIDLFLRARHEYRKFLPVPVRRSVALFEEAVARSPADPTVRSGMAAALARLAFYEGQSLLARAHKEAEVAVAAAPSAGEPHLALGSVLFQLGDTAGAVRALRAAVTRAPGLAEGQASLGRIFTEIGAVSDAHRRLEAALLLDPDMLLARQELMRLSALEGRDDRVEDQLAQIRGNRPSLRYWIGRSRFDLWRRRRYVDEAYTEELRRMDGPLIAAPRLFDDLHHHGRLPAGAPDLLAEAAAMPGLRGRLYLYQMAAEIHGFLGDRERALAAVELAAEGGLIDRLWLERCPLLDDIRTGPRFASALAEVARRADHILSAYRAP
jgi:serine/threonine-protein kinase